MQRRFFGDSHLNSNIIHLKNILLLSDLCKVKTEFNKTFKSSGMLDKFKSMLDEKKIVTYEFISVLDLNQYFSALGPLKR